MAEVAAPEFHISGGAFDVLGEEDEIDDRSYSYWPYEFEHEEIYSSDDSDDPFTHHQLVQVVEEEEEEDYDDIFPHQLNHQETPDPDPVIDIDPYFGVIEDETMGMGREQDAGEEGFFVGRRVTEESSEIHDLNLDLNLQGYFSEDDVQEIPDDDDDVVGGVSLCWDSLRLEEEWEDVDDRGDGIDIGVEDDEDALLGLMMDYEERVPTTPSIELHQVVVDEVEEAREETMRNLDWQVLLQDVNDLERDHDFDLGPDDFVNPAEYDTFFGQFLEHESTIRGSPPAAKSVVEGLPSIVLTQEDIQNKGGLCAVCKDEISTEEKAKQLPCLHYYHGECILPWLNIRNTCPVCRFDLPTDDPEFEQRRTQRNAGVSQVQV